MARSCTVCIRPDAGVINAALAEGRSARSVALEHGLSEDAVQRHARRHTARPRIAKSQRAGYSDATSISDAANGWSPLTVTSHSRNRLAPALTSHSRNTSPPADPLDELVDALREQALAGNPAIVHQYRLALAAQATVRHAAQPVRDLADEPEWHELRATILRALDPYPEARRAVAVALGAE